MQLEYIIRKIVKELGRSNLSIFVGAGLSKGAGFPDWKELLDEFAEELNLSSKKETDLISLAQFSYNNNARNRNEIDNVIRDKFTNNTRNSRDMDILASLPVNSYWTTNYDTLIEDTLKRYNKKVDIKRRERDLSIFLDGRDVVVHKMHGDVSQPEETVFIRDDYESFDLKRGLFTDTLCGELVSKTFLFIGYSFSDPNFDKILSKIRIKLDGNQKKHYTFIMKVNEKKYKMHEDFLYDKVKQDLRIQDLKLYGIECIKVSDYSEITEILEDIKTRLYKRNVFMSGSAYEYGDWEVAEAANFVRNLCQLIIEDECKIISGYGLGIGGFVIEGSSKAIFINELEVNNHFELYPFPQKAVDSTIDKQDMWESYRKKLLSKCSIAIFVFGNKLIKDEVIEANGVMNEFNIAIQLGLKVVPVGSTGYAARTIISQIEKDLDKFPYLEKYLDVLKKSQNAKEIHNVIKNIMKGSE